MNTFKALRVTADPHSCKIENLSEDQLTPGEVVVEVHYSSLNYKDALAVSGRGKILRKKTLTPGIDASGIVLSSTDARLKPGQPVLVTGCGIGETDDGGLAERLRVKASSVIALPGGLTLRESMILGTAGFTAALAVHRMLINGQTPALGPIAVTGATGGVGSLAVQILAQLGFETIAITGRPAEAAYLKSLGAHQVISPQELNLGSRPLESIRFGGAIDNVGGKLLAQLLAHTQLWGNVVSIGLADSSELNTTVMPFILRGVSLLGASSNNTPGAMRSTLWTMLADTWKPKHLEATLSRTISLSEVPLAVEDFFARKVRGRILVEVKR